MKKIVALTSLALGLLTVTAAHATAKHTISLGYAQTKMGHDKLKKQLKLVQDEAYPGGTGKGFAEGDYDKLKGLNIKYRYEFDESQYGIIASLTSATKGYNYYIGGKKKAEVDASYGSLLVGPTYRFNDYVSAYVMGGIGYNNFEIKQEEKVHGFDGKLTKDKRAFAYGAGLQFNPIENIAIDLSYERAEFSGEKAGTWVAGLGYRF